MKRKGLVIVLGLLMIAALIIIFNPKWMNNDDVTIAVVSYMNHPVMNEIEGSFKRKLSELTLGKINYKLIEYNAQGSKEQIPIIMQQIKILNPDIIVPISTPVAQYLMREAGENKKIVYTFVTNPDDLGNELYSTNSTGLSDAVNYQGNINLIHEILGESIKIGMIYNPNEANSQYGIARVKDILKDSNSNLILRTVNNQSDIPLVLGELLNSVDCVYIGGDNTVVGAASVVVREAFLKNIPVFASDEGTLYTSGAIAGISVNYTKLGEETASVVYKVLNGEEPINIARQTISGDKLIINEKNISELKIHIPTEIYMQADSIVRIK